MTDLIEICDNLGIENVEPPQPHKCCECEGSGKVSETCETCGHTHSKQCDLCEGTGKINPIMCDVCGMRESEHECWPAMNADEPKDSIELCEKCYSSCNCYYDLFNDEYYITKVDPKCVRHKNVVPYKER